MLVHVVSNMLWCFIGRAGVQPLMVTEDHARLTGGVGQWLADEELSILEHVQVAAVLEQPACIRNRLRKAVLCSHEDPARRVALLSFRW